MSFRIGLVLGVRPANLAGLLWRVGPRVSKFNCAHHQPDVQPRAGRPCATKLARSRANLRVLVGAARTSQLDLACSLWSSADGCWHECGGRGCLGPDMSTKRASPRCAPHRPPRRTLRRRRLWRVSLLCMLFATPAARHMGMFPHTLRSLQIVAISRRRCASWPRPCKQGRTRGSGKRVRCCKGGRPGS